MRANLLKRDSMFNANKYKKFIGKRFGYLVIIDIYQKRFNNRNRIVAFCKCKCLIKKEIILDGIIRNGQNVVSCGCNKNRKTKERSFKHGLVNHSLYRVWCNMKHRCYNKDDVHYHRYGGRGIKICDKWIDSFVDFYKFSMKKGWKKGLTIDRINNNGDYKPLNCRFVTIKENCRNTSICRPIKGTCLKTGNIVFYKRVGLVTKDGFTQGNISSCLRGRLKSSGGYRWEYV